MTELRSVRGSWPSDAVVVAVQRSEGEGMTMGMGPLVGISGVEDAGEKRESVTPSAKVISA